MNYRLGIDLGATNIAVGLVDEQFRIVGRGTLPTNAPRSGEELCDDIAAACRLAAGEAGADRGSILSAGVGAPGMCDHTTGELIFANNLKLCHLPLGKMLSARLGLPCRVENDANAAAFGECIAGAGRGCANVLVVTLGTGVGGGLMLDGKLYTGAFFAGAELGHMPMVFGGRPCNCGRRGCIETYCSATGLIATTREAMAEHPESLMWGLCGGDPAAVNGRTAFLAKEQGDPAAAAVVELYLRQLADALSGYINFIEPELLLLGGGIAGQGEALLAPLRQLVAPLVYQRFAPRQTELRAAALGNDAGIIGAAFLDRAEYC